MTPQKPVGIYDQVKKMLKAYEESPKCSQRRAEIVGWFMANSIEIADELTTIITLYRAIKR